MTRTLFALAPLTAILLLAAGDRPATRTDMQRMQGAWSVVSLVNDGDRVPAEALRTARFVVRGNQYRFTGEHRFEGTLSLQASAMPKQINSTFVRSDAVVKSDVKETGLARGIYEFDGERLIVCWSEIGSKKRPRTFASEAQSGQRLIVLEKANGPNNFAREP